MISDCPKQQNYVKEIVVLIGIVKMAYSIFLR